jgi:hypothetical protein
MNHTNDACLHLVTKKSYKRKHKIWFSQDVTLKISIIVNSFGKNTIRPTEDNSTVGFVYQTIGYLRIDSKPDLEKRKSLAWEQIWIWIDLVNA